MKQKPGIWKRIGYFVLGLVPTDIITDYAWDELELTDHDGWNDMKAGAREARRGG